VSNARWINSPKTLCGIGSHKYLDTMLYPCNHCKRHFAGTNKTSMSHDSDRTLGFFNMKLSKRFTVDEDLYSFIIAGWKMPTAQLRQQLEDITTQKYLSDYKYYLHALRCDKIKLHRHEVCLEDRAQETVDRHLREVSTTERTLAEVRANMVWSRLRYQSALNTFRSSIPFQELMNVKSDNNNSNRMLKKLGKKKLEQLMEAGILSGRELLECNGIPPRWNATRGTRNTFNGWKHLIKQQYSDWKKEAPD